jgi:peroxiredoxin/predicted 2-oxoglutarate/Fe(II)-dependent dioxygenase YbiX
MFPAPPATRPAGPTAPLPSTAPVERPQRRAGRSRFIEVGEPAPWFRCDTTERRGYAFDSVGGVHVVLSFFGTAAEPGSAAFLSAIVAGRDRFDDANACFFGVSVDPQDAGERRVAEYVPGLRFFMDLDRRISARYGAALPDDRYRRVTYILDPALRVLHVVGWNASGEDHARAVLAIVESLPKMPPPQPAAAQAPVLVVPRVFEPELCRTLIAHYHAVGGHDSGFMVEEGGMTRGMIDYGHKRRRDVLIEDEALRTACMVRVHDRLLPELRRAYQFNVTRMERYLVACYDGTERGHFRRHRDNTTRGTAHRRFAVSLFLNTGEYEGGFLRFPEFGNALFSAPVGGAVVFSCSMLHEAMPVTHGQRFMFLPFLYDEAGRTIRDRNLQYLDLGDNPDDTAEGTQAA